MKQFHVEVPCNPDGMIELFYKHNFECYDSNDFKIEHFTEQENELLQNLVKKFEELCLLLPLSDIDGNWYINSADMKEALQICEDMLKSCVEPEISAINKLRTVLEFAEKDFKPVHFFTDEAMLTIRNQNVSG